MKNPLRKRLPRELRQDIGKLLALFLFLTLTIAFVSGFLVADGSMVMTAALNSTPSRTAIFCWRTRRRRTCSGNWRRRA